MKQTCNLLDKEFKELAIKILTELWIRRDEHSENFNKELEKKSELKNTRTEMKNKLDEIHSTVDGTEEHISDLEDI